MCLHANEVGGPNICLKLDLSQEVDRSWPTTSALHMSLAQLTVSTHFNMALFLQTISNGFREALKKAG